MVPDEPAASATHLYKIHVEGKSLEDMLNSLGGMSQSEGSPTYLYRAITVRVVQDFAARLEHSAKANDELSRSMNRMTFWIMLAAIGAAGAAVEQAVSALLR